MNYRRKPIKGNSIKNIFLQEIKSRIKGFLKKKECSVHQVTDIIP